MASVQGPNVVVIDSRDLPAPEWHRVVINRREQLGNLQVLENGLGVLGPSVSARRSAALSYDPLLPRCPSTAPIPIVITGIIR